ERAHDGAGGRVELGHLVGRALDQPDVTAVEDLARGGRRPEVDTLPSGGGGDVDRGDAGGRAVDRRHPDVRAVEHDAERAGGEVEVVLAHGDGLHHLGGGDVDLAHGAAAEVGHPQVRAVEGDAGRVHPDGHAAHDRAGDGVDLLDGGAAGVQGHPDVG